MEVIIRTSHNPLSDAGITFFCSKYGFTRETLERDLPLKIFNTDSGIALTNDILGWIEWKGFTLPVFSPPGEIEEIGKNLASYQNKEGILPCVTKGRDSIIISFDIFLHLGLCVSGHLEKVWVNHKEIRGKIIRIPFADFYADILFTCIMEAQADNNLPLVYKAFWPEGKSFAVCLTHDIDEVRKTYQWLTYPARKIFQRDWIGLKKQLKSLVQKIHGDEPFWTFEDLADLEDKLGVRSSLYFLHETARVSPLDKSTWRHAGRRYNFHDPKVQALIQDLFRRKWDIGLHGSFYSFTNEALICSEKNQLEQSLGHDVYGGRQHNLNLKIPDTWLIQEKAGLLYDSTLGYNHSIGFRWGISTPFWPYIPEQKRFLSILQIPLAIEDLPYFRSSVRWNDFLEIYHNVSSIGGLITLLWHHPVFNENEYPGWGEDYKKIIQYCMSNNGWITDAKSVSCWWRERQKSSFTAKYNNGDLRIYPVTENAASYLNVILPPGAIITGEEELIITNKTNTIIPLCIPSGYRSDPIIFKILEPGHGNSNKNRG